MAPEPEDAGGNVVRDFRRAVWAREDEGGEAVPRDALAVEELRDLARTVLGAGNSRAPAERTAQPNPPGVENHARAPPSRPDGVTADHDERGAGQILSRVVGPDRPGAA